MKRISLLTILITFFAFSSLAKEKDGLSKAEKKAIKKTLKEYKKNPAQYKSMIENYKATIDTNEAQLDASKKEMLAVNTKLFNTEKELASVKQELEECKNKPVPTCPDPGATPKTGTVYKVQFGLYEKFDLTGYFDAAKYMGVEKVEGLNRYLLGYFDTEEQAEHFVADMRKMGIKDAFVAKYTDGARVMEWNKNPNYKGKAAPATIRETLTPEKK